MGRVLTDDVQEAVRGACLAVERAVWHRAVEGFVIQAGGYALSENLQVKDGHVLNPRFSTYLIPGIGDIPGRVESVILEEADPLGPWGVRGMAEMPYLPLAPAVAAALYDATGVWFDEIPLVPYRVVAKLRKYGAGLIESK